MIILDLLTFAEMKNLLPHLKWLPFIGIIAVYIAGWPIEIMDVDASQYASIAKEMVDRGEYFIVTNKGSNYLDKPPLIFWMGAISYLIFGVSTVAFKIPATLFAILGMISVYKWSRLYYSTISAYWSSIIFGSSQALFLMTNDVRTDIYLTSCMAFTMWHLAAYVKLEKWSNLIWGFIGVGLGMLAKGPIALVLPALALGPDIILKRQWRKIFDWKYLVGLLITGVVLSPMIYSLWLQFDSNPNVEVNGLKGVSGLRFFFWTQSFGRITGENVWDNNPARFFLLESTAWALLPYTLLIIPAWIYKIRIIIKYNFHLSPNEQTVGFWGFTLGLLALSQSHYQLPHYAFVCYPFAAIMMGNWVFETFEKFRLPAHILWLRYVQLFICMILWVVGFGLVFYVFPIVEWWVIVLAFVPFGFSIYYVTKKEDRYNFMKISALTGIGINLLLSLHFYPNLLRYQSTVPVGRYMSALKERKNISEEKYITFLTDIPHSLDFYSGKNVKYTILNVEAFADYPEGDTLWVYTNEKGFTQLQERRYVMQILQKVPHYDVQFLSSDFLNPRTRPLVVKNRYLLELVIKRKSILDDYKLEQFNQND